MRELGKCKLVFKDESGNPVEIEHEVFVGVPIQRVENLGSSFPAFIGKDFIDAHGFSIINESGNKSLSKI